MTKKRKIKYSRKSIKNDPVNPAHYTSLKISPVEFIEENNIGFAAGNAIKYISRYKMKNGIEDLKKARWYIDYLIKKMEGNENGRKKTK